VKRTYLQVGVKGGAAVRLRYVLDLNEDKPAADDEVFDSQGVRVRVDQKSSLYLSGTTIDFVDNDDGKGFVFKNPNAVEDSKKK
jgi:iron-sulfur cluster assembly protein